MEAFPIALFSSFWTFPRSSFNVHISDMYLRNTPATVIQFQSHFSVLVFVTSEFHFLVLLGTILNTNKPVKELLNTWNKDWCNYKKVDKTCLYRWNVNTCSLYLI
jgi:hypothetical protein